MLRVWNLTSFDWYRRVTVLSLFALMILYSSEGFCYQQTANWPSFRGPNASGSATDAKPPTKWSNDQNIKWSVELAGKNNSSPIVWGDHVFVTNAYATEKPRKPAAQPQGQGRRRRRRRSRPVPVKTRFETICFHRGTGKELWRTTAAEVTPHEGTHPDHQYASASPVTDGKHIYSFFGSRGLYCYDMKGKLVWKKDDFGKMRTRGSFGEGSSPSIYKNYLIVPWDHEGDSKIYALDKLTGKILWEKDRDEPSNWVTPVVCKVDGMELVVTGGENYIRAYNLKDGNQLWKVSGLTSRPISSPVLYKGLAILASARGGTRVLACRLDEKVEGERIAWNKTRTGNDVPSLLLSENRLYILKGSSGILGCYDAKTGEELFSNQRVPGIRSVYSSPVAAGGFVYITGRDGTTVVIKDSEEFQVVSTNKLSDPTDASFAISGDRIFVRSKSKLYCIAK